MRQLAKRLQQADPLSLVKRYTLEVSDLANLKRAMGWAHDPLLDAADIDQYEYLADLNQRRLRDAEVILTACRNHDGASLLEIGTAHGHTTANMSRNAPSATIHTVNIPPEEITAGGTNVTFAPSRDDIGRAYRQAGCNNVQQIFANTATWEPNFGPIDVAFIDGCHDSDFVYNDTRKILKQCRPGSIILWHDFAPNLAHNYDWIHDVCVGIERLYQDRILTNRILHLRDSWVGLYQVPQDAETTGN